MSIATVCLTERAVRQCSCCGQKRRKAPRYRVVTTPANSFQRRRRVASLRFFQNDAAKNGFIGQRESSFELVALQFENDDSAGELTCDRALAAVVAPFARAHDNFLAV